MSNSNTQDFTTLATGPRSALWLRVTFVRDAPFLRIPKRMRRTTDCAQVILSAAYPHRGVPLAIKLDLKQAASLGHLFLEMAAEEGARNGQRAVD